MSDTDFTGFINLHESVWDNPKTFALAQILSCERTTVVGMLVRLWQWSRRRASPVVSLNGSALAELLLWKSDGDRLIQALVATRWLDQADDGKLIIHDWHDYLGVSIERTLARRTQNRDAQRRLIERKRLISDDSAMIKPLLSDDSAPAKPPLITIIEQEQEQEYGPGPARARAREIFDAFEQIVARPCTPAEIDKLTDLEKEHGNEHTLAALAEARDNNARSLRYIETVLESWRANGYDKTKSGGKHNGRSAGRNQQVSKGVRKLPGRENYTTPEEFRAGGEMGAARPK